MTSEARLYLSSGSWQECIAQKVIEKGNNLWLDTAMISTTFFPFTRKEISWSNAWAGLPMISYFADIPGLKHGDQAIGQR